MSGFLSESVVVGVTPELLHKMQEKFPIFMLIAAGLLDLSGASGSERRVSEILSLSIPEEVQPRPASSPVPSEVFSVTEDDSDEVTFHFHSPAVDPAHEMTAAFIPIHAETAAKSTVVPPAESLGNLEVPEQSHTEAAALKLQGGHTLPTKILSSTSIPVSTQGSQAAAHPEQRNISLQGRLGNISEAGFSPTSSSTGLPQPARSGGTQQDSSVFSSPVLKQMEMPSPKTSLLTSVVSFHPPSKEIAASPFPTGVKLDLEGVRVGWLPTGTPPSSKRPKDTNLQVEPGSKAAVTPVYSKKTQSTDAKATTPAFLQKPSSGDLGAVYSTRTQTTSSPSSSNLSAKQETTARNSTTVINGSGHPTRSLALQTHPQGTVHSSLLERHLEAPDHEDFLPSPFPWPLSTTDRQQPLSVSRPLNCTKHISQETSRRSQEITVLVLQGDTDHQARTSKPETKSPESLQAPANSSSLSPSQTSTLKHSQATKGLKGGTPTLFPGLSTFEKIALRPVSTLDSVHAGLQPPATPYPTYMQLKVTPTSAEKRLLVPTSPPSTASGSQVQGVSIHPASRAASPTMLQLSTVEEDSKRKKSLPQQVDKTGSPSLTPPASPVPRPSELPDDRNQKAPLHSFAPSASPIQQTGSLAAFPSKRPTLHAEGSRPSSTAAQPAPGVPGGSGEIPAYLAQALGQRFGVSQEAATQNLGAFRADQLTVLPSAPSLSFLLKMTNGSLCLQPVQDSPLPVRFPNASVGRLVSIQQILAASNSSVLDLASLQNLNISSVILVKPVFILLPADRPDLQVVPSPEGEGDRKAALLFSNKQDLTLGTPDIPVKASSYPTSKALMPEPHLSTVSNQQAEKPPLTSQPVPTDPNRAATARSFQAFTSALKHLLDPQMRISPTAQAVHPHKLPVEVQIPAPSSQETRESDLLFLNGTLVQPVPSSVPPPVVSAQPRPHISPKAFITAEKPHFLTPLPSAKRLPDFARPSHSSFTITGAAEQVQHDKQLTLPSAGSRQSSATVPPSAHAPCMECLTSRPARTIKYPPEVLAGILPLQPTSRSLLSADPLRRLPSQVRFVSSTSTASSVLRAGNDHGDSAVGSTVPAKTGQTHSTSIKPNPTKHLEFTPFITAGRVKAAPAHAPFSTKEQVKSGFERLLSAFTHPRMYTDSPASPASPLPTRVPLLSAMKHDQVHQASTKLSSQADMGASTKPTETSTSVIKQGADKFLGTSASPSSVFDPRTQQPLTAVLGGEVVLTPMQPFVSAGSVVALERQPGLAPTTPQAPSATTPFSAAKNDYITSLKTKTAVVPPTPTTQSDPNIVLPAAAGVNESAAASAPRVKVEDTLVMGDAATTQAPGPSPHQKVSLHDDIEHETGRSSPDAGASPTKAFPVSANRLVNKVANQSAPFSQAAVGDAEMLLAGDLIQLLPSPEGPSYSSQSLVALTPQGDSLLGLGSTGQSERPFLNTEAEETLGTNEVTEEAAEGLVTVLTLLDSEPSALLSESHQRRLSQSDAPVLNGLAVVSDDACLSGNYTVRMSLRPAAEAELDFQGSAPPQETFLAFLAVQTNSSQPVLQIRSCCVTPSANPEGPGATCCLFHRLPFECRHIQLLQSSKPRAVSFTIQLFQMLNHTVAYLHCELNICLRDPMGCGQDCFESVEPSDRNSYGNPHNLISFGPVWRTKNEFRYKPAEGPGSAMLVPVLLGSLTGFAVLGGVFISLWLHHKQKTKSISYPRLGETCGL